MKSKISFINRGIFFNAIRRFSWVGIIYSVLLFFAVPMNIIMYHGKEIIYPENIKVLFYFRENEIQGWFILIIPVLLCVITFKYMHFKNSSDMFHCLPIKRTVLFRSYILVGIIILALPVIINGVIAWCLKHYLVMGNYYVTRDIIKWMAITLLMDYTVFIVCVFSGMVVGYPIAQGILTYILLVLPLGFVTLLFDNIGSLVYGFSYPDEANIEKLSPASRIIRGFYEDPNRHSDYVYRMYSREFIVYIIGCVLVYFLAKFLYEKRRLEAASQSIVFKSLQYVFKYGMVFCSMLLAGSYFYRTQDRIYLGYFIGSIIGYFVAEMIIKKSFWVFKNIRGYAFYVIVMFLILEGIKVDITGYEKRMPALESIKAISYNDGGVSRGDKINTNYDFIDKNNIESIYKLHGQLISNRQNVKESDTRARSINITYKLDDGRKIKRLYKISDGSFDEYLKQIYETEEYKKINYGVMELDFDDVEKIDIYPRYGTGNKHVAIVDPREIKEAIEFLKQDTGNESYEEMRSGKDAWANIAFMIADNKINKYYGLDKYGRSEKRFNTTWEKSYVLFEEWLKQKGYLENARVMPKDIEYILIEKVDDKNEWQARNRNGLYVNTKNPNLMKITDKVQIEECLRNTGERWNREDGKFIMGLYWQDESQTVSIDEKNMPDFIKSFFNK